MEPYNIEANRTVESVQTEAFVSIAVSLKRIADVMERYAASELPPAIKEGKDNG